MEIKQGLDEFLEHKGYDFEKIVLEFPCIQKLEGVKQDALWHGEGNVLEHTKCVCKALVAASEWYPLSRKDKAVLYMAALFHDIGKGRTTLEQEGRVISPNHSKVGAKLFREICYKEYGERFDFPFDMREEAAWLIRYHGLPLLFMEKIPVEYELVRARESVRLELLYQLGMADVVGRECYDKQTALDTVDYFREYAREIGCYAQPIAFSNGFTRYQYFQRHHSWIGEQLYDSSLFDVYIMAGLPLSGKDTYISENMKDLPVISLDTIRAELNIRPDQPSGTVIAVGRERAKVYLRTHTPFVWNATNVTAETRQKVYRMCTSYGARVKLIYLEAPYQELLRRNQIRGRSVPVKVIDHLIHKMDMVESTEAYDVIYPLNGQ